MLVINIPNVEFGVIFHGIIVNTHNELGISEHIYQKKHKKQAVIQADKLCNCPFFIFDTRKDPGKKRDEIFVCNNPDFNSFTGSSGKVKKEYMNVEFVLIAVIIIHGQVIIASIIFFKKSEAVFQEKLWCLNEKFSKIETQERQSFKIDPHLQFSQPAFPQTIPQTNPDYFDNPDYLRLYERYEKRKTLRNKVILGAVISFLVMILITGIVYMHHTAQ